MDYSQLSDFEINVAVFEAIHNGSPDYKEGENGDMVFVSFEGDIVITLTLLPGATTVMDTTINMIAVTLR